MSDSTSLDLLNDIVLPAEVSWWPPAAGWYVVATALGIVLLIMAWRWWNAWRENRYRRLALKELASIRVSADDDALSRVPALLKRTALSAWPREVVASLSGPQWHEFLDRTAGIDDFGSGAGKLLDEVSYGAAPPAQPSVAERESALRAAENWLRRHDARTKGVEAC